MKRPHNRTHCSAPEKGIGKNKGVPGAPSSFFISRLFQRQKISKQFSSSTIVGCGRLSHLDSALPIGEVFYWASSSCPSQSLRIVKEKHILLWVQVCTGELVNWVSWWTQATQEFWPLCSAVNAVQSASLGITVSVHTAFTSCVTSFMQSQVIL